MSKQRRFMVCQVCQLAFKCHTNLNTVLIRGFDPLLHRIRRELPQKQTSASTMVFTGSGVLLFSCLIVGFWYCLYNPNAKTSGQAEFFLHHFGD